MANRFPLVVNTATSRIAELPAGDGLDLTGNDISNVGSIIVSSTVTASSVVVNGFETGTKVIPQVIATANYVLQLIDSGKQILHPSSDTLPRTFSIPANSVVPFDIGTAVTFINQNAAGDVSIEINGTDILRLAGDGSVGLRTLTANGLATAIKLTATEWIISGVNLS